MSVKNEKVGLEIFKIISDAGITGIEAIGILETVKYLVVSGSYTYLGIDAEDIMEGKL